VVVAPAPDDDPGPVVVFTGTLVEESADPDIDADSDVAAWPTTLDRLLALGGPNAIYVPGREVVDAEFVHRQRDWLSARTGCGRLAGLLAWQAATNASGSVTLSHQLANRHRLPPHLGLHGGSIVSATRPLVDPLTSHRRTRSAPLPCTRACGRLGIPDRPSGNVAVNAHPILT